MIVMDGDLRDVIHDDRVYRSACSVQAGGGSWIFGLRAMPAQADGGLDLASHNPRCSRMARMTAGSSMKLMIRMAL
jgi:hypothetical protein